MQRASNPWDRFYRYHEAPWRGERPVADLVALLGSGRVLELGCGNGKSLKPLAAAGVDVVGLDISWHILRRLGAAQQEPPASATAGGRRQGPPLVLADASRLPFRDASFTAVLDIHCTGHLLGGDRRRAAAESFRVLAPGGRLVVERLSPNDLRAQQGRPVAGEPDVRAVQDGRTTSFAAQQDLAAEFEAVGFVGVGAAVDRHFPGHGGRQVTRESIRLLFERPAVPS